MWGKNFYFFSNNKKSKKHFVTEKFSRFVYCVKENWKRGLKMKSFFLHNKNGKICHT